MAASCTCCTKNTTRRYGAIAMSRSSPHRCLLTPAKCVSYYYSSHDCTVGRTWSTYTYYPFFTALLVGMSGRAHLFDAGTGGVQEHPLGSDDPRPPHQMWATTIGVVIITSTTAITTVVVTIVVTIVFIIMLLLTLLLVLLLYCYNCKVLLKLSLLQLYSNMNVLYPLPYLILPPF